LQLAESPELQDDIRADQDISSVSTMLDVSNCPTVNSLATCAPSTRARPWQDVDGVFPRRRNLLRA